MKHKHAELIKAWADGAEIEFRVKGGEWMETVDTPAWKDNLEYRIKPEEKKPVVRWLWAFEAGVNVWEQYTRFMTEEEVREKLVPKFKCKRLDWSRQEFDE